MVIKLIIRKISNTGIKYKITRRIIGNFTLLCFRWFLIFKKPYLLNFLCIVLFETVLAKSLISLQMEVEIVATCVRTNS